METRTFRSDPTTPTAADEAWWPHDIEAGTREKKPRGRHNCLAPDRARLDNNRCLESFTPVLTNEDSFLRFQEKSLANGIQESRRPPHRFFFGSRKRCIRRERHSVEKDVALLSLCRSSHSVLPTCSTRLRTLKSIRFEAIRWQGRATEPSRFLSRLVEASSHRVPYSDYAEFRSFFFFSFFLLGVSGLSPSFAGFELCYLFFSLRFFFIEDRTGFLNVLIAYRPVS